ncbi:Glycosyltransferase sugar-binding region containing DXD motif-containing protein [Carboxydocella sporoproducens DSM 16521]|uniref:Glycosyltransferase sugar-binding region containing DXD motif-containing protein n=2 Tax=Carboxydocella TaxID=178898 RepID=A0A1T4L6N9_9FIRM|nr:MULTISPECIES: glycosyltransferase [Carboxydocella]AVX19941.1 Glycosyltransferase sugar-binding region containing DXD motif-containing protein [Carboxydocella thermautotrophica]SJZ50283.1 Glycosyltransferase sugar-binding region containing DXD motif-containing protein [Carboxydocella sporoproducens DSM 16521]
MSQIPKIIHCCWFGNKKIPSLNKKCMKSWEKYLPDYQIILWNEENFDINSVLFTKQAYYAQKYAFVTDYVRIYVLYYYGGIYLDTDVEIIRNIDHFLKYAAFTGFENEKAIPTGIIGAKPYHPWIERILDDYNNRAFIKENGEYDLTTNVKIITQISIEDYGLKPNNSYQILKDDVAIFPNDYFCPKSGPYGKIIKTNNTYAIHHFAGSWVPLKKKITLALYNYLGEDNYNYLRKLKKTLLK